MTKWNWEQGFKKGFGSISDFLNRYVDYAIRDSFQKKQEQRQQDFLKERVEQDLINKVALNALENWNKNNVDLYRSADIADENTAGNATVNVMGRTQRVPTAAPKNIDEKIDYVTYGDIINQLRAGDLKGKLNLTAIKQKNDLEPMRHNMTKLDDVTANKINTTFGTKKYQAGDWVDRSVLNYALGVNKADSKQDFTRKRDDKKYKQEYIRRREQDYMKQPANMNKTVKDMRQELLQDNTYKNYLQELGQYVPEEDNDPLGIR